MGRPIRVLFLVSQLMVTPAISVHASLMRYLDRERVEIHVAYPRMAARPPWDTSGRSSLAALPETPEVGLRAVEFGPEIGPPTLQLLGQTARAAAPALRDMGGLIRFIYRRGIDIIHCEEGIQNAFYAYLLSKVTPAKSLVHFHLGYGDWILPPSRLAIGRADAIISVSAWTGRKMAEHGVSPERIFPVLNGIDVSKWDPAGVEGTAVRRELAMAPQDPLIVQVAQLVDWKRQHLVIEALPRVLERYPTARLMLVGAEQARRRGSNDYTERLERQVADAGLERQVIFAGRRGDIREVLAAADLFTLPSIDDPCALAFLEAMAMGKPVVSVRAGGTPEIVEEGKAGLLGEPDDVEQLAANLLTLLDDPEQGRRMGEYGRKRVLEHFFAQRMADDVESVYRFVVGAR